MKHYLKKKKHKTKMRTDMVVHACNPNSWDIKVGKFTAVWVSE